MKIQNLSFVFTAMTDIEDDARKMDLKHFPIDKSKAYDYLDGIIAKAQEVKRLITLDGGGK